MTQADEARLEALIKGAFAADEGGNVAVAVRDLRWLVCLVDALRRPADGATDEENHEPEAQ